MGRPRANANRAATSERILDAAADVFGEQGFASARLGDIAGLVGIRRPSLLYHFSTKEALYEAVVVRAFAQLGLALRAGRAVDGPFVSRLEAMTRAFVRFVDEHPSVARLVVRELLAADGPGTAVLLGQVAPMLDEVEAWIRGEGAGAIRTDVPIRAALLQVVSDTLLRSSAGALRQPLWGPADQDHTWRLAAAMILAGGESC